MQSLTVQTGEVRLSINGDPDRVISFSPSDVLFAEKFYRLMSNFRQKFAEFEEQGAELDINTDEDEDGIPVNAGKRIELLKNVCEFAHKEIDELFGAGTSLTVFGGVLSLEAIAQFFDGITPYIGKARVEKIKKYSPAPNKRQRRRK